VFESAYAEDMWFQGSLLDTGSGPARPDTAVVERRHLAHGAWVDYGPGWLSGADELFLRLREAVPWRAERREMYDRTVDVPRLVCSYGVDDDLPDPVLVAVRDALNDRYGAELGEPFVTAGLCYYRDGRDSVAWHGDRIGRGRSENTMVAIVSLGAERRLSLRPRAGVPEAPPEQGVPRESIGFPVGHGDLLVMGGTCQRTWDHAVLKTAKPVGPRISVQFRPLNVL
jgi:alkylated DNA repair dioxygenase AlkB